MPQVASDINAHALKPTFQHAARPPQSADRAAPTPFESLLDDTAQPPPSRSSPDDNAPRADHTEPARRSDRTKDSKDAKPSDDTDPAPPDDKPDVKTKTEAKPDAETADKPDAKSGKPVVVADTKLADDDIKTDKSDTDTDGKPAADAKTGEQAVGIVDVKPAGDAKPVNVPLPVDPTAVVPTPTAPTITPADAIGTVLVPAPPPVVVTQTESSADATAIVAATQTKPGTTANLQADVDKSVDEKKALAKTALQAQADAKPQAGDPDKDSVAQFRGETPVNGHRGAGAEAPAPVTADPNLAAPKTGADMMPPTILNAPAHNTAPTVNALAAATQPVPQAAPIPLAGVAFEITNKALAGKNHFEIRLDPPELGRIEVRLDVDRDGNVTSRMIADRSDTLDLLRRDAPGLERALQDAGLKTADNSLQFSLRDQSMGQQQTNSGADTARLAAQDEALAAITPTQIDYSRLAARAGGLDIRV